MVLGQAGSNESDKVPLAAMSNDFPMSADRSNKVVTEHVAYTADLALQTYIDDRTKFFVDGVQKQARIHYFKSATVSGGNAVFYVTDDGTSGGAAVFTNVFTQSIACSGTSTTTSYFFGTPTISGDKKSITIPVNQLLNVLGIVTLQVGANGAVINLSVFGD